MRLPLMFIILELAGQVVTDGVRQDEVAVGQTLHQGRSAEAVAAVVGEVGFADGVEAGDGGHQVVVHPEAAHRVVDGRVDHHRLFVRIDVGDFLIHVEEVAVAGVHDLTAEALEGILEVEEYGLAGVVHTVTGVAALLGGAGSHVTRNEVAEGRVAALEVVVAVFFGNLRTLDLAFLQFLGIFQFLGNPDAAVVTQRFGHQGQLGLLVAVDRDTGRVDLRKAGVGEESASLVALPCSGAVGVHGIGAQEVGVAITAGGQDHGVGAEALDLAVGQVAGDDAFGLAVDQHQVEHLVTGI